MAVIACFVVAAFAVAPAGVIAAEQPGVEGTWKIVSVEFGGFPVPGMEGGELAMAAGKKVLSLPGGKVEKGTYKVAAAEIDSTTEGKEGTEKGIFAIEGDRLTICLAMQGGPRPEKFDTALGTDRVLIHFRRSEVKPIERKPIETRPRAGGT
jgi:uncharacterized protein (TIGR03067 family)